MKQSLPAELWLHVGSFALGIACGDFIEFRSKDGEVLDSYWPVLRDVVGGWVLIGEL